MNEETNVIKLKVNKVEVVEPDKFEPIKKHVTSPIAKNLGKFASSFKDKLSIKDILR